MVSVDIHQESYCLFKTLYHSASNMVSLIIFLLESYTAAKHELGSQSDLDLPRFLVWCSMVMREIEKDCLLPSIYSSKNYHNTRTEDAHCFKKLELEKSELILKNLISY